MGSNPKLTASMPTTTDLSATSPANSPVQGAQIITVPKGGNLNSQLAMPIYVGSTPTDLSQMANTQQNAALSQMNLPKVDTLPTPPWMIFQQNAIRLPQANQPTAPPVPTGNNPAMGTAATAPAPVMPTPARPVQQGFQQPQQQVPPPQPQAPQQQQPPAEKTPPPKEETKPEEKKSESKKDDQAVEKPANDAFSKDTIREINAELNDDKNNSVRVNAAGRFLMIMIGNPELSQDPRYHDVIDAFLEKILKDPAGDVRASAYRAFESANITTVSPGVHDLLQQRAENDGVMGIETDSLNTILATVKVETPPKPEKQEQGDEKKAIHKQAQEQEKAAKKKAKTEKKEAHRSAHDD